MEINANTEPSHPLTIERIPMIRRAALVGFLVSSLAACNNTVSHKALVTGLSPEATDDVKHLTGVLMTPPATRTGAQQTASATGMAGAALAGQNPLSSSGVSTAGAIGGGLTLASWLLATDERSMSAAFVPAKIGGKVVSTKSEAEALATAALAGRLEAWAKMSGATITCAAVCDGRSSTFRIVGPAQAPIYVTLKMSEMVQMEPDPALDRLLGYRVGWRSALPNGAHICVTTDEIRRQDGAVKVQDNPYLGSFAKHSCDKLRLTAKNIPLLRALTSDGRFAAGSARVGGAYLATNGRIYKIRAWEGREPEILGEIINANDPDSEKTE